MGKKYIEIEFCNDNPLSKRFERNNQGGKACYCMEGNTTGKQKTKDGWKPIECNEQCQYRQKDEQGNSACNRIGWLKFFIPSICQNRIWLMRITGQESINRLDAFINLEKAQEHNLKGRYILFLKQKEQTSKATGKSYNNYILDIVKKEDFIFEPQIPQTEQKDLSTKNTQNVNNNVKKEQQNTVTKPVTTQKSNMETKNAEVTKPKEDNKQIQNETTNITEPKETTKPKRQTKSKTKKAEEKPKETTNEKQQDAENYDNYYVFESLSSEKIQTKSGPKDYTIGKFYDMQDKQHNIIVKPEYASELQNCELGTLVQFTEIKEIEGRKFALDLNFIQKMEKNIAA